MSLDNLMKSAAAIFTQMEEMAKWGAQGVFDKSDAPEFDMLTPFDLDIWKNAFDVEDPEKFLTDKPLIALTDLLAEQVGRLRYICAEGTRIHLIAMPCTNTGKKLKPFQLNDELSPNFPYITLLKSNPEDKRGMCLGSGLTSPVPLIRVLPKTINDSCSFVVKYPEYIPTDIAKSLKQDKEYLLKEFQTVYSNLQKALKPKA